VNYIDALAKKREEWPQSLLTSQHYWALLRGNEKWGGKLKTTRKRVVVDENELVGDIVYDERGKIPTPSSGGTKHGPLGRKEKKRQMGIMSVEHTRNNLRS
jgi:hypothetical protein